MGLDLTVKSCFDNWRIKWNEIPVTLTVGVYDLTNSIYGQGGTYTFNAEDMTHTADKHVVSKGDEVTLAAAPADGYEFAG